MNVMKAPEEIYTGANLARVVHDLREDGEQSLGESFCKKFGTEQCPFGGKCPEPGYCHTFEFKVSADHVAAVTLIQNDAELHRKHAA